MNILLEDVTLCVMEILLLIKKKKHSLTAVYPLSY